MMFIGLTKGKYATIDDADYELVKKYKWTATFNRKWYAKSRRFGITTYMHRLLMKTPHGLVVHHEDNDGLNNCRNNLQNMTIKENTLLGGGTTLRHQH